MKIEFIAEHQIYSKELDAKPILASEYYPKWLKELKSFFSEKKIIENLPMTTVKRCVPFNDARMMGYYFTLVGDVWLEKDSSGNVIFRTAPENFTMMHNTNSIEQIGSYPIPEGYDDKRIFKWTNPWIIKTSKNWSCLFTQPYHIDETPFYCFTGLVDTDKFPVPINFPFLLKKNFKEGLIPKGTPIVQIIPFKREKFKATYSYSDGSYRQIWHKACNVFFDRYKKFFHQKKEYGPIKEKCPFSFLHNKNT